MKNYPGAGNSSSHKKGVQSMGGPAQLTAMSVVNTTLGAASTSSMLRHTSMTPNRNSNIDQVLVGHAAQQTPQTQILLANQKNANTVSHLVEGSQIPQKATKQISSSQARGNLMKKQRMQQPGGLRDSS